jgi:hypothetical protein
MPLFGVPLHDCRCHTSLTVPVSFASVLFPAGIVYDASDNT